MKSGKETAYLTDIKNGQTVTIVSILGGKWSTKRLVDLGLTVGTEIKMLRSSFFSGPIEIEVGGSKLALGRGLAYKIMVELK
jgi:Fe2+ transport system protein FeoA